MFERAPKHLRPVLYGVSYLVVLGLFAINGLVTWLAFHPNVSDRYRAYYLDKTTTCLFQPMDGTYAFGSRLSFKTDGPNQTEQVKVCGWEGPVGDGTHAVGETSRLRLKVPANPGRLRLALDMLAVKVAGHPQQRVRVSANDTLLGEVVIPADKRVASSFVVPAAVAAAHDGFMDIDLDFPDAILMDPRDSNTRKRSIKLQSVQLEPLAAGGPAWLARRTVTLWIV